MLFLAQANPNWDPLTVFLSDPSNVYKFLGSCVLCSWFLWAVVGTFVYKNRGKIFGRR